MLYKPEKIYIDAEVSIEGFAKRILQNLDDVEQIVIKDKIPEIEASPLSLTQGKRILHLKNFHGSGFKLCPGYSDDVLCCNYFVIDLIEHCPLECTYCILQAFLNKPVITFHVNVEEIIETMVSHVQKNPKQLFRIGTGEHSDSLALDHIFEVNPYLVETFTKLPNATLELKTKTDNIDGLLGLDPKGRTVVAWSLNPPEIIKENEFKTASLEARLQAASKLEQEGYKIAFHFDPLIHYPQWQSGYKKTVEMIFDAVSPDNIAWISLGTLRYISALKSISEKRFSNVSIFANEFIAADDGKMRYLKPIRKKLLGALSEWIHKAAPTVPLYLCMEKRSVWNQLMNTRFPDSTALETYLSSKV